MPYNYKGKTASPKNQKLISLDQLADGKAISKALSKIEEIAGLVKAKELENVRTKDEAITMDDLGQDVIDLLEGNRDDSYLRKKIASLEKLLIGKMDRTDLLGYRKNAVPINKGDLDASLIKFIEDTPKNYFDSTVNSQIASLKTSKANKSDTGCVSELTHDFKNILENEYGEVNLVNALNYIFKLNVNYYSVEDSGYLEVDNENVTVEVVDSGVISDDDDPSTQNVEVHDFGTLFPEDSTIQYE
jgi:hypothetical protein